MLLNNNVICLVFDDFLIENILRSDEINISDI